MVTQAALIKMPHGDDPPQGKHSLLVKSGYECGQNSVCGLLIGYPKYVKNGEFHAN